MNPSTQKGERIYTKQIILEDMIGFYRKHNRWPKWSDYVKGFMLCSGTTLRSNNGLVELRQQAMQLKEEQDTQARAVILATNRIEMEYAGRARA